MTIFNDEFDGVGGSYLLDPATGKRTRIPEEGEAVAVVEAPAPASKKSQKQPDSIITTEGV